MKKTIKKEIDRAIKEVWLEEVCEDYAQNGILMEASLQCSLYHHLRNRLEDILEENDLRIYSEYRVKECGYRADLAIVHLDMEREENHLRDCVDEVIAIIELKHVSNRSKRTISWIKEDVSKLKDYAKKYDSNLYLGVIYENDFENIFWMDKRSTNNWADGVVTELNAGYYDDEFYFEVNSYNHMNFQNKRVKCEWE